MFNEYMSRINDIPGLTLSRKGRNLEFGFEHDDDPKIATKQISLAQKQLRLMKKELVTEIKQVRARYRDQIEGATYQPGLGGTLLGSKYRSSMKSAGAARKRALAAERDKELSPYEQMKDAVTEIIDRLSILRDKITLSSE